MSASSSSSSTDPKPGVKKVWGDEESDDDYTDIQNLKNMRKAKQASDADALITKLQVKRKIQEEKIAASNREWDERNKYNVLVALAVGQEQDGKWDEFKVSYLKIQEMISNGLAHKLESLWNEQKLRDWGLLPPL